MATEVNQNCFAWPREESPVQDSSQGTTQVFDHGSISFGRFDLESLEWEKWSVFTNDRRTEEFVKFNGLVAKKKAYFEEYFKRIRELKALQQQNQQTELNLEYSGDGSDSSQTGEDEPVGKHASPAGSGTHFDDCMGQIAAESTSEHGLGCYNDHNKRLSNGISSATHSSSAGGLQMIGEETGENASVENCSDRMDMLQQNAKCSQDDLVMPHETKVNLKRTIEKCSPISQASKIIPRTVKMTSSCVPDQTFINKGPQSSNSTVINQKTKPGNVQSLRKPRAATSNVGGTTVRSKLVTKEDPGVMALRRPSSAASQRPSSRERRPVTRDGSRGPASMASPCRPSTAQRRLATRDLAANQTSIASPRRPSTADKRPITKELAPKDANIATPRRPSTADRRPITKESAPKNANTATPCRPSTPDRRLTTKELTPKHANVATPQRPSTAERRPITRESAPKLGGTANPCWPSSAQRRPVTRGIVHTNAEVVSLHRHSTAERRPLTRETAPKHGDVIPLRRPSTAERRPVSRETAPKPADAITLRRPSTAERRPVARDSVLKHANVGGPGCPSTPERRLGRESAPKHAAVAITPCRPSTGEKRPTAKGSSLKLDPKTPIRLRGLPDNSNGAMVTAATPKKAVTPNLVKARKPEIKSYVQERLELQVGGKQKSSSVNLPPRKILSSDVRANRVVENARKPNKQGIQETLGSRVSASKNATSSHTGSGKTRAPNPPPPPPPPRRLSQSPSKPEPPTKLSAGGRKPKASTPHWH
ncbi:proteoglycan 4-like isoform X2 [Lolium rigidum]|uniref:proteoglycan 4-like isoform X2 n=1 Tax=Lolium rigidum TaxID=89674 RepID=UPI001F5D2595|nr:proteoglycan 4-like isoform X2 [Lolium rigidum]